MREIPKEKSISFRRFKKSRSQRRISSLSATLLALSVASIGLGQVATGGLVFFGDRVVKESIASTAPIQQISAGGDFAIALRADGSVAAWGNDAYGQCDVPKHLTGVTQVAAGTEHALLLMADGTVRAIGWNNYGQTNIPKGLNNVVQVAAGSYFSVALLGDGTVVQWGYDSANLRPPAAASNIWRIAAGEDHIVALRKDGSLFCWGTNNHNECNYPSGIGYSGIAASYEHSAAVRADGTITCWGSDNYHESDPPMGLGNVGAIFLGPRHGIAFSTDGKVTGWGSNANGEGVPPPGLPLMGWGAAGLGTSFGIDIWGQVHAWGDSTYGQTTIPNSMYDVAKISGGWGHVLMLKHDKSVAAWGRNLELQCNFPTGNIYTDVSAGAYHNALTGSTNPQLDLFGKNDWGQLNVPSNLGTLNDHYWAVGSSTFTHQIAGGISGYGMNAWGQLGLTTMGDFVQVTGGLAYSAGLRANGTVAAAGIDGNGQLDIPMGLSGVTQIAGGYSHGLALKSDGTVATWGDPGTPQAAVPSGLSNVTQVAAGRVHSVALKSDGTVVSWGTNSANQVSVPLGLTGMAQIAAGEYYTVCLPRVSLSVAPYLLYGGQAATGTVYVPSPAPANGTTITLVSSDPTATVPGSVFVPSGATSANFPITTTNPKAGTQPIISASFGSLTEDSLLTVDHADFTISSSVSSVIGGSTQPATITIKLTDPAPALGLTVSFSSSDPSVTAPSPVVFFQGQQVKTIPLVHNRVHATTSATLTASDGNSQWTASMKINPFQVTAISIAPATAISGGTAFTTVTLNAATNSSLSVPLTSSVSSAIPTPTTLVVQPGWQTGTMNLPIGSTQSPTPVVETATVDGSTVTQSLTVVPAVTFTLSSHSVVGGSTTPMTLTINLPAPAPSLGLTVQVVSDNPAVNFQGPFKMNSGQTTRTVTLNHLPVVDVQTAKISVTCGVTTQTDTLTLSPFQLASFQLVGVPIIGGGGIEAIAVLNATPKVDTKVLIESSDNVTIPGPITLTVQAFENTAPGAVWTTPVTSPTTVTLSATLNGSSIAQTATVDPALASMGFRTQSCYGGTLITGTVFLTIPAPVGNAFIDLTSTTGTLVSNQCIIGAGKTSGTFQIYTKDVSSPSNLSVTASHGKESITALIKVNPNVISSMVISPSPFAGNTTSRVTATVTLTYPVAYDVVVAGTSSNSAIAALPVLFVIPAGSSKGIISLTHSAPAKSTVVTLTATRAGASKAVNVRVN